MNHSSSSLIKNSCMLSFMIIAIMIITNANLSAQNLLITDYKVPVSSARSFRIDLKGNYATVGRELTTNKTDISGVYKSFYESLPYAYSFDCGGTFTRNLVEKNYEYNYSRDIEGRIKRYIWTTHDLFGSIKVNSVYYSNIHDRPREDMTIGLGFGRFVNVTSLAKAVRIEDFLLSEGLLYDDLPAQTMIQFGQTIERESEFKNEYGDAYKVHWYEEMTKLIQESGMLKGERVDAIGILRMDEVLFRQRVHDRFYGWDATVGTTIELLTSYEEIRRQKPAADITVNYSRPLSWHAQWNERLTVNSPMDKKEFMKAYKLTLNSDFSYEMTNRIDFVLNHFILIEKSGQDVSALFTNSLRISFVLFVENSVNLVTSIQLDKAIKNELTSSFEISLNYRVF